MKQAEEIREFAIDKYIKPARASGDRSVAIRAGDVAREMHLSNRMPAITAALGANKFEELAHVRLVRREGPQNGANLVLTFDLAGFSDQSAASSTQNQRTSTVERPLEELRAVPQARPLPKPQEATSTETRSFRWDFSDGGHRDAVLRRRIKFVVEKGAMARLFARGTHLALQHELFRRLQPTFIAGSRSVEEYDHWLQMLIQDECWIRFCKDIEQDRWAYVAKLLNIVIYEIASNRELFCESEWQRIRPGFTFPLTAQCSRFFRRSTLPFPFAKRCKA